MGQRLGMEGGTDGHRTRDGLWDRWILTWDGWVGQIDTGLGMNSGTDGH